MPRWIEIDRFEAADERGRKVLVIVERQQIDASTLAGRKHMMGMQRAMLADGARLNRVDEETFEIVETGERIRKF